jgi:hypothetical protein
MVALLLPGETEGGLLMIKRELSPEVTERLAKAETAIAALLKGYEGDLQALGRIAEGFFRERSAGESFSRRPNLSIRLVAPGSPPARLIVYPEWRSSAKQLNPSHVQIELVVDRLAESGRRAWEIRLSVKDGAVKEMGFSYRHGEQAAERVGEIVRAFVDDPFAVFAQSADHCCMCGRPLIDEVSRARGIGPECLQRVVYFRRCIEERYMEATTQRLLF